MDWDAFLDTLELASLKSLRKALEEISEFDRIVSGKELVNQFESSISRTDSTNCLFLLLDSGALTIKSPGLTIEKYCFIIEENNRIRLKTLIRRLSERIEPPQTPDERRETIRFLVTLPPMIDDNLPDDIGG